MAICMHDMSILRDVHHFAHKAVVLTGVYCLLQMGNSYKVRADSIIIHTGILYIRIYSSRKFL